MTAETDYAVSGIHTAEERVESEREGNWGR